MLLKRENKHVNRNPRREFLYIFSLRGGVGKAQKADSFWRI